MSKRDDLADLDENLLFMDPEIFDQAIMGCIERAGQAPVVCYSKAKVLEILMEDGMSWEEADDYYYYNIVGAYMGDRTPVFLEII